MVGSWPYPRLLALPTALGLTHKHQTRLEGLARQEHSSLMQPFINFGCKKCYDIGGRLNINNNSDDCNSINNRHISNNNSLRSFIRRCRITRISDPPRSSDRNPLSIPSRCQCYKTFYGRNLRIFVISQSVCPWQVLPAYQSIACLARQGAYPRVKHLKGASFMQAPALSSNIRLCQKGCHGQTLQLITKIR